MMDVNVVKNLKLGFIFGGFKRKKLPEFSSKDPNQYDLWEYITQGLAIRTASDHELAKGLYDCGYSQLTAPCNNLEGEMENAASAYRQAINGLDSKKIWQIKRAATDAIFVHSDVHGDLAKIDKAKLKEEGVRETPQVHRAMSYKAKYLRAERQKALSLPLEYHRDYSKLRQRLKDRPPIAEVEQDLPEFWQELRKEFAHIQPYAAEH